MLELYCLNFIFVYDHLLSCESVEPTISADDTK